MLQTDQLKVCTDRILPRDLMRAHRTEPGSERAIRPIGKTWMNGTELHVRFLGGTVDDRVRAKEQTGWWSDVANIKLAFDDRPDAQIRIAFDEFNGAHEELEARFNRAMTKKKYDINDVDTGREYVQAELGFVLFSASFPFRTLAAILENE